MDSQQATQEPKVSGLEAEISAFLNICVMRAGATPEKNQYHKWVEENRAWVNNRLREIGRKHQMIWNVMENRFVEVSVK